MARARRTGSGTAVRAAAIIGVGLALIGIVAFRMIGSTRNLELNETAETDRGDVAVIGWSVEPDGSHVTVRGCRNGSGAAIHLDAFRVVSGERELEPSGSRLRRSDQAGCVEAVVVFPAVERIDEVRYLASPLVVWRDRSVDATPSPS